MSGVALYHLLPKVLLSVFLVISSHMSLTKGASAAVALRFGIDRNGSPDEEAVINSP